MKEECVRVAPDEEACIKLRLKRFILPEDTVQGAKNEVREGEGGRGGGEGGEGRRGEGVGGRV